MTKTLLAIALGAVALFAFGPQSEAQTTERTAKMTTTSDQPRARHRKKARVYGYTARRGGYSYEYGDVANTYGLSRSLYGSTNVWRDPSLDRQTPSGPFDHDFFFDSGGPRGGNSPYLH